MELIKPGRYTAVVVEHGITETKNKDPQATILFGFETDNGYKELKWFGSFKNEKAVEITISALVVCGLEGNNPSGPLKIGQEVSITIDIDQDLNGKDRNVVRWVNKLGGIGKKIDDQTASAKLEKFSGAVMAIKQKAGGNSNSGNEDVGF